MGHIHLGVLPRSKAWREVVDLLQSRASSRQVVQASADAAERSLSKAADNPDFVEIVRLLAMIPQAAKSDGFGRALRDLGIPVRDDPELIHILAATGGWLDRFARQHGNRNDFGEMARRTFLSTLSTEIGSGLPGLFEATPADVKAATRNLATSTGFSRFARGFFTQLLSNSLGYWLDRTLSAQMGADSRFSDLHDRSAFDAALRQYSFEATRIISEFAGGWYGVTLHREKEISSTHATVFGAVAFKKISAELQRKRGPDA